MSACSVQLEGVSMDKFVCGCIQDADHRVWICNRSDLVLSPPPPPTWLLGKLGWDNSGLIPRPSCGLGMWLCSGLISRLNWGLGMGLCGVLIPRPSWDLGMRLLTNVHMAWVKWFCYGHLFTARPCPLSPHSWPMRLCCSSSWWPRCNQVAVGTTAAWTRRTLLTYVRGTLKRSSTG